MRHVAGHRLAASVVALAVGIALVGVATAQEQQPAQTSLDAGLVEGAVARCVNGAEQPAPGVAVGVEGGSASLVRTDSTGAFILGLPPGTYTIVATTADAVASRQYVPVNAGDTLDIGILDLGGGVEGCAPDSDVTAPVLPTFTPTATAVPDQPAAPPAPTATPVPPPPLQAVPTAAAG